MTLVIPCNESTPSSVTPLYQLELALDSGNAVWERIQTSQASELPQLLCLIFIIEENIELLLHLCMLWQAIKKIPCSILERLKSFYLTEEIITRYKQGPALQQVIQKSSSSSLDPTTEENYYSVLSQSITDNEDIWFPSSVLQSKMDVLQDTDTMPNQPTTTGHPHFQKT
jgi:hypothetical protein